MPQVVRTERVSGLSLLIVCALGSMLGACGGSKTQSGTANAPPAANSATPAAPASEPLPASTIFAFTWFDKDQGPNVSKNWVKARDAMAALGGQRFSAVFATMDWERETNLMAVSGWDAEESAIRGLKVSEAQVPARGWAKSSLFRRIAADGDMSQAIFNSVVMVLPISAAMDSAKATADFNTVNDFMRTQPGYVASVLFERVSGDGTYQHLIAARWAKREDLQRVATVPAFQELRGKVEIAGVPTTYLQLAF
jgi:hypothetical protein